MAVAEAASEAAVVSTAVEAVSEEADSTGVASAAVAPLFMVAECEWAGAAPSMPGRTSLVHFPGRATGVEDPTPFTIGNFNAARGSIHSAPYPVT